MIVLTGSVVFALALSLRSIRGVVNRRSRTADAQAQSVQGKKMPVTF
jgi:hypothetical protein